MSALNIMKDLVADILAEGIETRGDAYDLAAAGEMLISDLGTKHDKEAQELVRQYVETISRFPHLLDDAKEVFAKTFQAFRKGVLSEDQEEREDAVDQLLDAFCVVRAAYRTRAVVTDRDLLCHDLQRLDTPTDALLRDCANFCDAVKREIRNVIMDNETESYFSSLVRQRIGGNDPDYVPGFLVLMRD